MLRKTADASCPEGWEEDQYNFYSLGDEGPQGGLAAQEPARGQTLPEGASEHANAISPSENEIDSHRTITVNLETAFSGHFSPLVFPFWGMHMRVANQSASEKHGPCQP